MIYEIEGFIIKKVGAPPIKKGKPATSFWSVPIEMRVL